MATQLLIPWFFFNIIYNNQLIAGNLELSICKFHLTGKKENPIFINGFVLSILKIYFP